MATPKSYSINLLCLSARVHNALIIRLMGGGGNLLALNSIFTHTAGYCPHRGGRRLLFCMALCAVVLLCGGCRQRATFGGVAIPESPWSFAAALDEQGTGLFLPESVEKNTDKAVISGWYDTCAAPQPANEPPYQDHYVPAKIFCDLNDGRITYIAVYCDDEQSPRFTLNLQSEP